MTAHKIKRGNDDTKKNLWEKSLLGKENMNNGQENLYICRSENEGRKYYVKRRKENAVEK